MEIEHALGGMEGLAKIVIDKIIANPKGDLTKEEQYTLYSFTMMQEGRTLAHVNLIQEHADTVLRNLMKNRLNYYGIMVKHQKLKGLRKKCWIDVLLISNNPVCLH